MLDQPLVGLNGYDSMAAVNEDASVSNTALTDATASCTIGRQAIQRQISDINDLVDSVGINVETMASMVGAATKRFTSMVSPSSAIHDDRGRNYGQHDSAGLRRNLYAHSVGRVGAVGLRLTLCNSTS